MTKLAFWWGVVLLVGCTRQDDAAVRRDVNRAAEEIKTKGKAVDREIDRGFHAATREVRKDLHEADRHLQEASKGR